LRNEFALRSEEMNNAMLSTEKASLQTQQEKNQYLLVMALVLVLILGILAILFIREANRKQKQAKDLEGINKDLSLRNKSLAMSEQEWKTRNESKDTMFSIIAHDLKSPLNSITGFVEVLTTHPEAFSGKELADYGKKMQETITNLNSLLTNLLQWAMMQNGKIEFSPGPLMLKDFLSSALSLYYPLAESKMVTLELKECPDISIQADYNMLHFVVRNLLHNAIKFSKPNGEVSMHVRASTSHCIIEVSDKGVGISGDRLKTIFDSGNRSKTPGTMQEQGTGLGLILCKEFVDRHGGQIEVDSKEGSGSVFRVTLPIKGY
jgi:two-component system sensor histidine kinase/response regulator